MTAQLSVVSCQLSVGSWQFVVALLWAIVPQAACAQLDPEVDKPYRLQVVVRVADNRFLTPIFQEQLRGSLRDQLQLALGPLANVEVTSTHPLLGEIETKGLDTGLDGWEQISEQKTHFVFVDFAAGIYTLKARQYDGMTGLRSPGVRLAQTSDRALVAQTAAHMVEQDFALVGTASLAGKEVHLALKGGKLGVNLERWVRPGEVFAISRITKEGDRLRGTHVPWALLEVMDVPRDGMCRCRLFHRFQADDLSERAGVLGYRCLKLATTPGALKLQFVDDEQFAPLVGLQVHILRPGRTEAEELTTNQGGLVVSRNNYQHFAVVQVRSGAEVRAQFPVALIGERTVVCRLKIQPDAENLTALEFRKDLWVRRIMDNRRVASERVANLNSELGKSLEGALELARAGLSSMDSEVAQLDSEREQILLLAAKSTAKLDLREGELALEALRMKKKELEAFVSRNESVLKEATSPAALARKQMLEQARLFELDADFDQAIALWEKVLEAGPDQLKVKEHLAKLKLAWTPKNPRHAEARAFLIKTWPKLEVPELQKNLSQAREALDICKEAGDKLTPIRVLRAIADHTDNVQKHLAALKRQTNVDSAPQAKAIAQAIAGLRQLHQEASAIVGKK
jgi:hypothetical protein